MAKRTVTAADSSTPLEQLDALHKLFLDRFNRNSVPMGEQLTSLIDLVQQIFGDVNKQLDDDDKRLAELEALWKKAEDILKRLEDINLNELDPVKIKEKVLKELAEWQAKLEKELDALRGDDKLQNGRLDKLESDLSALRQKVEGVDFQNLDPEKIKQKVVDALAAWRSEIGNAILAIQKELREITDKVGLLEKGLEALKKQVDGIDIDPEKIKQSVLAELSEWQQKLKDELQAISAKIPGLENRLAALEGWKPGVDIRLVDHGKHLLKHDEEIAKLVFDLKKLDEEVAHIISEGGPDPEDIKQRVLAALEAWRKKLEDQITALDTRLTKDESDIIQHGKWILELQKQVADILAGGDPIDPDEIKKQVLAALAEWQNKISDELLGLRIKLEADEGVIFKQAQMLEGLQKKIGEVLLKITGLEGADAALVKTIQDLKQQLEGRVGKLELELAAQVARLDARISAIETTGVDPDDVRKIIEEEFKEWKLEIVATFVSKTELISLTKALDELTKRVDALKTDGLNAEQVRALLHAELDDWRKATDLSIHSLETRLGKAEGDLIALDTRLGIDEAAIEKLKTDLGALQKLVEEKLKNGVDPEEIKDWVLAELAKLHSEVTNRLQSSEKKIVLLKSMLDQVKEDLENFIANAPNAEAIKNQILLLIGKWQNDLERGFQDLKGSVGKDIKELRDDLDELEGRVNKIILTGGTPAEVEERIRKAIEAWEAKLKRELDAIRKRNEEDRTDILNLRNEVINLHKRVRLLEVSDFGKAIKDLSDRLGLIGQTANDAKEKAGDVADDLEKLTKQDGVLDKLEKQLNLLLQQSKHWIKKEDVLALIEEALKDIEACKKDLCEKIKTLEDTQSKQGEAIEGLKTADKKLREDLEKKELELEEKIGQVGVLMEEADDELEDKIKDAEKDAKEYARDRDQDLETKLGKRFDRAEGRLDRAEKRLHDNNERDEEQRQRIEDLQRQIDEWKPDPSGDVADRLARRCLEGHGIVCGFDVWHSRMYTLYIGPGAGVTSDGHIIKWNELEHFTHFHALENAAEYDFFVKNEDKNGKKETWPVWRLLAEKDDEKQPGVLPLPPQHRNSLAAPFIRDKIVLALLDPESHPDSQKVTFVLMSRHHAIASLRRHDELQRRIAQHPDTDFLFKEDFSHLDEIPYEDDLFRALRPEFHLREIPLPRFGLYLPDGCGPEELDSTKFPGQLGLDELFNTYSVITGEVFEKVERQMRKVLKLYRRLLFPQFGEEFFSNALNRLDEKWTEYKVFCKNHLNKPTDARHFIQYFYDWARDLINAYHELRSELLQLMAECCSSDTNDHPRHLMLGLAMREEHNGLASPLRHEFAQPPIYNGNAARLETCRLYLRRWLLMVKGFLLPIHDDPETNPVCCCDEGEEYPMLPDYEQIKITPGRSYFHPFSRQSIPFYYLVTLGTQSVHRFWDYRRSKTLIENQHLCYHANDTEDSYTSLPHIIRPLRFSLDAFDFYRIEGHIGKSKVALTDTLNLRVADAIRYMVQRYNLDFEVLEIDAANSIINYPKPFDFNTFKANLQGAEHLAGVPKGGTFILITEDEKVIGDFSLPYR